MDQNIIIALISTFGTVIVGGFSLIGVMLARTQGSVKATRKLAAEAKEQVTNNHAANFRDEVTGIGDNAAAIRQMLIENSNRLTSVSSTLELQNTSLSDLHHKVNAQGQSIAELTVSDKAQWTRLDAEDAKEK